jgi:DNA-binding NarL/FixJ family response regulator
LKRSAADSLAQAIRAAFVGGLYLDPEIAREVFGSRRRADGKPTLVELTPREADVLKLTALGFANKEIGRQLAVGVKSVETYRARGVRKLGLKSRAEIVRYAAAQGWLVDALPVSSGRHG